MKGVNVHIQIGYYRQSEIRDETFPVAKPWQAGKLGGFITVPASSVGATGNTVRIKCEYDDIRYVNVDGDNVEINPLPASLPTGQPAPDTAMYLSTGIAPLTAPIVSSVEQPKAIDPFEHETEEDAMRRMADTFQMLEEMAESAAEGTVRALVVYGPAGIGKTHGIEHALRQFPKKMEMLRRLKGKQISEHYEYEFIGGVASPIGLYKILYDNRDRGMVTVFDDCDSILFDEDSLNLLKCALDTSPARIVSWHTESKVLAAADIPKSFEYCGSVIFLTNVRFDTAKGKIGVHLAAIADRCYYLDLEITSMRDKLLRIRQVVGEGMLNAQGINDRQVDEVLAFIIDNAEVLREVSLRMAVKVAGLAASDPSGWRRKAEATCLRRDAKLKRLRDSTSKS